MRSSLATITAFLVGAMSFGFWTTAVQAEIGVRLSANATSVAQGEGLNLFLQPLNDERPPVDADVFVVLELFGQYFFHPSYTPNPEIGLQLTLTDGMPQQGLFGAAFTDPIPLDIQLNWFAAAFERSNYQLLGQVSSVSVALEKTGGGGGNIGDFFPYATGNTWTYRIEIPLVGNQDETVVVVGPRTDVHPNAWETSSTLEPGQNQIESLKADGLYINGSATSPDPTGWVFYRWPMNVGDSYDTEIPDQSGARVGASFRLLDTNATANTAAGTFTGCLRYSVTTSGVEAFHYVAPGVGLVLVETTVPFLGTQRTQLVSYTVN